MHLSKIMNCESIFFFMGHGIQQYCYIDSNLYWIILFSFTYISISRLLIWTWNNLIKYLFIFSVRFKCETSFWHSEWKRESVRWLWPVSVSTRWSEYQGQILSGLYASWGAQQSLYDGAARFGAFTFAIQKSSVGCEYLVKQSKCAVC